MKKALICIDFINEIVSPQGKLSGKGYASFAERHKSLAKVKNLQEKFRSKKELIIHIGVCFSKSYIEHPLHSPLFGKAKEFKALEKGSWGTAFHEEVSPVDLEQEVVIEKHRVSSFYQTNLELILRNQDISELFICGVATDLAVESLVREAHDRDFQVTVVEDACIAANDEDHRNSLTTMIKIASIKKLEEI